MSSAAVPESDQRFGSAEWGLSIVIAVIWGSSFLWISLAIDHVAAPVVSLVRCATGAAALACFPTARRRLFRPDVGRFAFLGLCWMAVPFLLYPIAEETVNTSVTGMINGGLPVVTTVVTALFVRRLPSGRRVVAVLVGAAGIALISLSSMGSDRSADGRGVLLLMVALVCYAVAVNVARPVQATYGALPTMLWITVFGTLWSVPLGVRGIGESSFAWSAAIALVVLGTIGTGIAFALYGVLLERAGPVRGMIGIFFTPIVGTLLGVTVRDDDLPMLAVLGMFVVIAGAVLTSRPEPATAVVAPKPLPLTARTPT